MLHLSKEVNGIILWANLHLLFWLSLIPFTTAWMDENHLAATPVALYGAVLFMAGLAYYFLMRSLKIHHGKDSALAVAIGKDRKGIASQILYAIAIGTAFIEPMVSVALYVGVALMWLVPDRRIENHFSK